MAEQKKFNPRFLQVPLAKPADPRPGGLSIGKNTDRLMRDVGICISAEFPTGPFTSAVRRELEKRD